MRIEWFQRWRPTVIRNMEIQIPSDGIWFHQMDKTKFSLAGGRHKTDYRSSCGILLQVISEVSYDTPLKIETLPALFTAVSLTLTIAIRTMQELNEYLSNEQSWPTWFKQVRDVLAYASYNHREWLSSVTTGLKDQITRTQALFKLGYTFHCFGLGSHNLGRVSFSKILAKLSLPFWLICSLPNQSLCTREWFVTTVLGLDHTFYPEG